MLVDITGNRYNNLVVQGFLYSEGHRSYWLCKCDCGKFVTLRKDNFAYKYSHQKSCGCLRSIASSERMRERHEKRRGKELVHCTVLDRDMGVVRAFLKKEYTEGAG